MADVVEFGGITKGDIPVNRVLDAARELPVVIVIGRDEDGNLVTSSSTGETDMIISMVAEFQHKILAGDYDTEEGE